MTASVTPLHYHSFSDTSFTTFSGFIYEIKLISRDQRSKRIFGLLALNIISIIIVFHSFHTTNSLLLSNYSNLIWIDFFSLLTTLLGFWVEQKKPNKVFTFGHVRCEILAVFVIVVIAQIGSLLTIKESLVRLSEQSTDVYTGRLLFGAITCLLCHIFVTYFNDKSRAFNHVIAFSSSNIFQEQLSRHSQSLCQIIPGISALLLPRVNPLVLYGWIGFIVVLISQILIEIYNSQAVDSVASLLMCFIFLMTIFPMSAYTAKILLQTAPNHMTAHLDKCLREASTLEGVLEFRNERFWTLGFGDLVGSLHVRIRRDANEQVVLAHLNNRLSNLVSDLTIQIFKDGWAWNPAPRLKYSQNPSALISSHNQFSTAYSTNITINDKVEERKSNPIDNWVQNV